MASVGSFHMEVEVPEIARALVIGKGGQTIKRFQQSAGISSARLLPSGKFQIRGDSREAVQSIVASIKNLIGLASVSKSPRHFPLFYRNCFCKSTENPLLTVDKVSFEKFTGSISCISRQGKQHLCFKKGEAVISGPTAASSDADNLAAAFSNKMSFGAFTKLLPHWDFSGYRSELLSCFECQQDAMRNIKMIVRFGKQLFHGRHYEDLLHRGFVSFPYLQQLCSQSLISSAFSTACSEKAVTDLRLHLERLDYVRVSYRRKISIHLTDREEKPIRLSNVSVRCLGEDGFVHNSEIRRILRSRDYFQVLDLDIEASAIDVQKAYRRCLLKIEFDSGDLTAAEKAKKMAKKASDCLMDSVQREKYLSNFYSASPSDPSVAPSLSPVRAEISRVRREPRRHGIVSFCREGEDTTDFRLAVMSHEREMEIQSEMVKWVEDAWANRTPDQLFVFDPSSRYQITNIRYKDAETYVTEDFKFRIANVREVDGDAENQRWECALTSRWSKWNDGIAGDVNSIVRNDVLTLIKEAVKFSKLMSSNHA
ncbi:hypothetical protein SUGI_1196470 [Cryptomeria japonica]|uniref:uncharacterized protein LOC131050676 n=1 Tax=Cryptomeria japonica TaxID=3369 RepID=UPI002414CE72|nr:uncharacterized protein LOC131050676 [Cryptomeria japonica]GLJ55699.1 hypothetical protein SUGI_1196470 [Cryptomeria japonica]